MITPLEQLSPLTPLSGGLDRTASLDRTTLGQQSVFGAIFQSAINNVKELNAETTEMGYLLATGQLDNPAALGIAQTKEAAALDMLIQLRNRALEAYSELTRINL